MTETSKSETEVQVASGSTEEEMDSSSHPEVTHDNILEAEVSKDDHFVSLVSTIVDTKEVCVKMDSKGKALPEDEIKSGSEGDEPVNTNTNIQADIKRTEPAAAESESMESGNIAADSLRGKSEVENTDFANQGALESVTEKSVPKPLTEHCIQKCEDIREFQNSGENIENKDADRSKILKIQMKEVDESTTLPLDTSATEKKTDQKPKDPSDSKDDYRETNEICDSDSEDSDSSSVSSLSSPSESDSTSDNDDCVLISRTDERESYSAIKAPGELLPQDLPPIEELHITVPSSLCAEIGVVTSIVETLVVIQSIKGVPALDLDSVLFLDNGSRALGTVFDVFGPVKKPLYCVRFNSSEHIAVFNVNPGDKVYYAPQTEHSKYVFLQQLLRMRGSDASKRDDLERGIIVEFSDDEEELKVLKENGGVINEEDEEEDLDQLKRKRDSEEDLTKKKKFAPQCPPRSDRNYFGRPQFAPRGRSAYRRQLFRPRLGGPIHPPNFSFPPPPIPGTSAQRSNPPVPQNAYSSYSTSQGTFHNQPYQNSLQQNASFGQLPHAQPPIPQPQIDPRVFQFGAQFAQMMCNLQNPSPTLPVNVPPPAPPSFSAPYNQPSYLGGQNDNNSFYKPPTHNPPTYSAFPFGSPPPMTNMLPTNLPPPTGQSAGQGPYSQHNHNPTYGQLYGSTYSRYQNSR